MLVMHGHIFLNALHDLLDFPAVFLLRLLFVHRLDDDDLIQVVLYLCILDIVDDCLA